MNRPYRHITLAMLMALAGINVLAASAQEPKPNNSALDGELFYRLIVGELSAVSGDNSTAFASIFSAARKASSEPLYERAVQLALAARSAEAALQATQDWVRAFPASAEANRYLLQILIGLNRTSESLEPLKRLLTTLSPKDRVLSIAMLPRMYMRAADKKLAASVVEQALASDLNKPTTGPGVWTSIGQLRLAAEDGPGALEAARRGFALNPESAEPIYLALNLSPPQSTAGEAIAQKFLIRNPSSEVRLAYAHKLLGAQRFAESYIQIQLINTAKPTLAEAWLLRGSLELQDRKLAEAEKSLQTYVTLISANSEPSDSGEMGRGLVQAYLMLAEIAEKNQKLDDANAYLLRINSQQDAVRVQLRRAMILARQGKMAQARTMIRDLPELGPTDARSKMNAEVQLLREYKQFPQAYQLLSEASKRDPKDVELVYELATIAEKMGKVEEMEQLLRRVIATQADYHPAYNALGYSLADRKLRLPEARQLIQKALEFAPDDPFIIDSLAWVEFRSGNSTEALRLLQGAYRTRPDAEIAAHLGEVLWDLGEHSQAVQIWDQGKALNSDNETLLETIQRLRSKP